MNVNAINTNKANYGYLAYQEQTIIQERRAYSSNQEMDNTITANGLNKDEQGERAAFEFEEVRVYQNKLLYLEFGKSDLAKDLAGKTRDELLEAVKNNTKDDEKKAKIDALIAKVEDYWKPEAVGGRIFDFAVGLFEGFKERYGLGTEQVDNFYEIIKGAVEEGYKQAKDMLGMLSDEVSGVIEETMSKFSEKFDEWYEKTKKEVSEDQHINTIA